MDIDLSTIIVAVVCIVALAVMLALANRMRQQSSQMADLSARVEYLASNLNALCSGAVGVDHRVARLERIGRDLEHRQESMETHQQTDRPYGQAIQMVHQGATVTRLIEELGLSRSEAELLVSLHGSKAAV
ncbi:DUF2802 domain-containing protein [Solemya velesiana gill symbiont]|uniref:DUF2802 domain-containing protein n=1 Tax=Solemya velesiana gill symbiont TaxID=1918948 RepID=A0A1T2KWM6_9GAMM|nr:DUF2802 domain-containing protein [Solemya velesiana gill symbiont]OOZ37245.1 hypothetical protein BOW51_03425 [Solemya velesiana gill symbiont]